jgi:hypothetical protein
MHLTVGRGNVLHDGLEFSSPWRRAVNPATSLKLSSTAFAVLWTGWMLWWSGSFDRVNIIMLMICGVLVGYGWYRAMRWQFRRRGMLPPDQHSAGSAKR